MKYTDWFPGDILPARPGVYERQYKDGNYFCRFDGSFWYYSNFTTEGAASDTILSSQFHPWRGLTLTDWIPGDVKPVRDGVYERNIAGKFAYSLNKSGVWFVGQNTPEKCLDSYVISAFQDGPTWRGIHYEP